jgi:hypothetical protein
MMKNVGWFLGAVFLCILQVYAVNTSDIESLRTRAGGGSTELSTSDTAVISQFWTKALDEMMLSANSEDMVKVRRELETQKGDKPLSFYATAYIAEALKDIKTSYQNAQRIANPAQKTLVERNLMILTANLKSPKLAPIALARVGDEDEAIRYWAVKAVTQPAVVVQLTDEVTHDEATVELILKAIGERILVEPMPEIQRMMIDFAAPFNLPAARQSLLSLAEQRKKAYQDWTVKNELLDVNLLTALGNIAYLEQDAETKKTFGRAFAELYAMVFQRYLKGTNQLSAEQMDQLTTVIAEVDQRVVTKVMGIQTRVLIAMQRKTGLNSDYELLFGNKQLPGELGLRFKFDYGKNEAGKPITIPPELGPMPGAATPAE